MPYCEYHKQWEYMNQCIPNILLNNNTMEKSNPKLVNRICACGNRKSNKSKQCMACYSKTKKAPSKPIQRLRINIINAEKNILRWKQMIKSYEQLHLDQSKEESINASIAETKMERPTKNTNRAQLPRKGIEKEQGTTRRSPFSYL